ncbi:MAG TPA: hypothetical protein VF185_01075 [Patescibacteria group bacterium]
MQDSTLNQQNTSTNPTFPTDQSTSTPPTLTDQPLSVPPVTVTETTTTTTTQPADTSPTFPTETPQDTGNGGGVPPDSGISTPPQTDFAPPSPRRRALIPTILGLVLLVVGVGAGLALTQRQQLLNQRAGGWCTGDCRVGNRGECPGNYNWNCSGGGGSAVGCSNTLGMCSQPSSGGTQPTAPAGAWCTGSSGSDRGQCPATGWTYVYPGAGCQQSNGSYLGRCCPAGESCPTATTSGGGTTPGGTTTGGEGDTCTSDANCSSPLHCITCIAGTVKSGQKVCYGNAGTLIACGGYSNATGRVCTTGDRKACGDCSGANGEPAGGAGPTQQAYCNALGQWDCIRTDRCGEIGNRPDGATCIYDTSCLSGDCNETTHTCNGSTPPTTGNTCRVYDGRTVGSGGFAGCGDHYNQPSNYDCFCNNGTISCSYDADRQSCAAPAGTIEAPTTPTTGGGTTPTNPPGSTAPSTAQCQAVKAYDTNWNLLTTTQLSALKAGDKVRFTVTGTTTSGVFDKARFTINGTLRPEVTTTKPAATQEFYDEYTIPVGVTSFTVTAQIHHAALNTWN